MTGVRAAAGYNPSAARCASFEPKVNVMTLADPPAQQRFLFEGVSWAYYDQTLRELENAGRRAVRVTYDRGRMEIMTTGTRHEHIKTTLGRLIETYATERDIPITGAGSVTCRREDLDRGLEPDECYYVTSVPPPVEQILLDLTVDAPPDLAVEVEVTRSSIPRQPIYGALGVPEVWRFDGRRIAILHRRPDGQYEPAERSLAFPSLPIDRFNEFLAMALTIGQHDGVRAMRDWARQQTA